MRVNYTEYSQYDTTSVFVTSSAELNAAVKSLANGSGGTVRVDPNGGPYDLSVANVGSANSPVLITSAGSDKPLFESVALTNVDYITIDGISVDTSHMQDRSRWEEDVEITGSSHVTFVNSSIVGGGEGYLSEATSHDVPGVTGVAIDESEAITFSGNFVSNYMYAVKANDTKGLTFSENEITQWQADAFHGGGLQDAFLGNNWLHLPLGSTQSIAHSDFFQIRMANTALDNRNIEIAGNIMDSEGGPAAQGIHMGTAGSNGSNTNISVHDNVIHSGLPRGIGIDGANGLEIYNNTLLWNEASWIEAKPGADYNSWDPRILVTGSGISVEDNVASWIRVNGSQQDSGGYQIQYKTPSAADYAGNHVVNLDGSGNPSSYDLSFSASSPLYGRIGATMSSEGTSTTVAAAQVPVAPVVSTPTPVVEDAPLVQEAQGGAAQADEAITVTFTLVNTESDEIIAELAEGDTLDAAYLQSKSVSIIAETSAPVGSVTLSIGDYTHTENGAPYALFGDTAGDYWDPETALFAEAGAYEIKAELFSSKGAVGKIGEASTSFSVDAPEAPAVEVPAAPVVVEPVVVEPVVVEPVIVEEDEAITVTFTLVNTETDEIIAELAEGDRLDAAYLQSKSVSIIAETSEPVGSVTLTLGDYTHTENGAPYALFGDWAGDYWDPETAPFAEAGAYEIKAELFASKGAVDKIGEASTSFSVEAAEEPVVEAPAAPVVVEPIILDEDGDDIQVTLSLIDTKTDEILGTIGEDDALDPSVIGSTHVSIVAELSEEVGSVAISIGDWTRIENEVPYALFGNRGDDYFNARNAPFTEAGEYEVKVEYFEFRQGLGKIGETTTTITVGDEEPVDAAPVIVEEPLDDGVVYADPTLEDIQVFIAENFADLEAGEEPAVIFDQVLDFLSALLLNVESGGDAGETFLTSAASDDFLAYAPGEVEEPLDAIL